MLCEIKLGLVGQGGLPEDLDLRGAYGILSVVRWRCIYTLTWCDFDEYAVMRGKAN